MKNIGLPRAESLVTGDKIFTSGASYLPKLLTNYLWKYVLFRWDSEREMYVNVNKMLKYSLSWR